MRTLWIVGWIVLACGCGDDKKGGGEACESDADCASGSCVEDATGAKACTADDSPGGW
jgi:hypothetical protein